MKRLLASVAALCALLTAGAQSPETIPLWPGEAPGARGSAPADVPTLTVFRADTNSATGAAMVICPGGGYSGLASHEGADYARWLNEAGISAFVLKYRLGSAGYRHPVMLQDAARAVRTVRARSGEWGVDPARVGIMGSSAGGHLASTLLTHFDAGQPGADDPVERQSSRPDLGILCYPVITMGEFTHRGSRGNLLGNQPSQELVDLLSNELQVSTNTPPCFLWHTGDDTVVPVENVLQFAVALRKSRVRFDLHIYEHGPHGLGLGTRDWNPGKRHPWTLDCVYWLRQEGFAK